MCENNAFHLKIKSYNVINFYGSTLDLISYCSIPLYIDCIEHKRRQIILNDNQFYVFFIADRNSVAQKNFKNNKKNPICLYINF